MRMRSGPVKNAGAIGAGASPPKYRQ